MIVIDITLERTGPAAMRKSDWNNIKKESYRHIATHWHRKSLPKHFTVPGAKKYGYAKRKGEELAFGSKAFWASYTGQKKRKHGHVNPLQFTGESKRRALHQNIRATRRGSRVSINAPALNFKPKNSRVNMRREVTTVVANEITDLAKRLQKKATTLVNRFRGRRKTRTKK